MPLYYFHDRDGTETIDCDGTELSDIDAARDQAAVLIGRIVADRPREFWKDGEHTVRCTDANGLTLFQITTVATDGAARR